MFDSTNIEETSDVISLLKKRWSTRKYDPTKAIGVKDLCSLFEAARWTPSAYNEQPWNFIIVTRNEKEQFQKVIELLNEGNKLWASDAFALVVAVVSLNSSHNNHPNFHALYDLGASVANLTAQAVHLNIAVNQMGGFSREKAFKLFNLDEQYIPVTVLALGYPPEDEAFEDYKIERQKKRTRKSLDQFVFMNDWGTPFFSLNDNQNN